MTGKTKALVILIPGFASSEHDSTCLPMQQAFVKAVSRRLKVVVVALHYPFRKDCYPWFDATVYSLDGRNRGGLQTLVLRKKATRILDEICSGYDIVGLLSFWVGECCLIGKRFAEKNALKHFCWIMGQDAREANPYPAMLRICAGEMVALSDSLQEEFEKNHFVKPFRVIPPGIEESSLPPVHKDIHLLAAGSLIPLKRFEIFIETVAAVKKLQPATKAVLVGDGPEKQKFVEQVARHSLEENLILKGELPHEEVLELMHRSRIFLHPSSYEGFPGVCLEALSERCPVISFVQPMKEQIDNWHVVLSKEAMIEKTIGLLHDESPFHPMRYRSIDEVAKDILRLFEDT